MKIGLIAMSGIRACDQELLDIGLTLPGFVERSKAIASLPSLGLLTLAGMTPRRHQIQYLEVTDLDKAGELPRDLDLVAISSLSAQVKEAYRLAERYVRRGVPVVMGGLHVSSVPDEPGRHGASAVLGEGEISWPRVLADAQRGTLAPVYDGRGQEFDLANSPMPAYELLDIDHYNRLTVQTSRGCPWRCDFCASSILLTRRYKQKPAARVLAEIDRILELWPRPFIEFADDNSFVDHGYWKELLPEIARRRIKWFTETDLSVYRDEALLEHMREAGCAEVLIGFESPTRQGLDGIEQRKNFKWRRFDEYRTAIRTIQRHGIRVNACFVIGLDGHTPEVVDDLMELVRDTLPFDVQVTVPTPFPGTPFHARLAREGRLHDPDAHERRTLFDVDFEPRGMSAQEVRACMLRLARELYCETFTAQRREHFQAIRAGEHHRDPVSHEQATTGASTIPVAALRSRASIPT